MGDPAVIDRRWSLEFVHRTWLARPRQLAPLRAEVRQWQAPLGLPGQAEDDLVLPVSEAASNCVELTVWTESHAVCIQIIDHGEWRTPSDQPTRRGSGIAIMQQLIASVLIRHDTRGQVFLRHPLPGDTLNALHLTPSDS